MEVDRAIVATKENSTAFVETNPLVDDPIRQVYSVICYTDNLAFSFMIETAGVDTLHSDLLARVVKHHHVYPTKRNLWLVKWKTGYLFIKKENRFVTIRGAFPSEETAQTAAKDIQKLLPKDKEHDTSTTVLFWCKTSGEASYFSRIIETPKWNDIRDNYEASVQRELDSLMTMKQPVNIPGRLLLWKGEPGTGKTYALRALCKEWKTWCKMHYIIDVDTFFSSTEYMMDMIMRTTDATEDDEMDHNMSEAQISRGSVEYFSSQLWNLLILEDAGELIAKDAKEKTGQALSKLLNLSDGLLGQGIKLFFLITTNEEDQSLSTAIGRPGRCFSNLSFNTLSEEEVKAWLKKRKFDTDLKSSQLHDLRVLSNLYAFAQKDVVRSNVETQKSVGFLPR